MDSELSSFLSRFCELLISSEPNVGIVNVPDDRLGKLGVINNSVKVVPASVSINKPRFLISDHDNVDHFLLCGLCRGRLNLSILREL